MKKIALILLAILSFSPLVASIVMGILAPTAEEVMMWVVVEFIALIPAAAGLHLLVEGLSE